MDELRELTRIDIVSWILTGFVIIFAVLAAAKAIEGLAKLLSKPVRWLTGKEKDHEKIEKTTKEFEDFRQDMKTYGGYYREMRADMDKAGEYYKNLSERMDDFMSDIRESIGQLKGKDDKMDKQMASLKTGITELLGMELDRQFSGFAEAGGVPEGKYATYTALYNAYAQLGGNGVRKEKHDYVTRNLKIIPDGREGREEWANEEE